VVALKSSKELSVLLRKHVVGIKFVLDYFRHFVHVMKSFLLIMEDYIAEILLNVASDGQ
jgi:hypothetical protein